MSDEKPKETTSPENKQAVAVAEKPAEEKTEGKPVEIAVTTDVFNSCTSRCTRRAWTIFLKFNQDIQAFKTKHVRGRLTFKSPDAAQDAYKVLVEKGGVTEITVMENALEFTATLAAVQHVIKQPETKQFDAVEIE